MCALCIVLILKQMKSEFAPIAAAAASAIMCIYCLTALASPLVYLRDIAYETGLNGYFTVMLKCLSTAFICKTASDICRDCGESSIGQRVEMGGRVMIILQTLPLIKSLFESAKQMLSG